MSKIAIMTFWESQNNYGQILQLFAMQSYLKGMGHEPYAVRYHRIPIRGRKTILKEKARRFLQNIGLAAKPDDTYNERDFSIFKKKYIVFGGKPYKSLNALRKSPPHADAYLSGSDQVWNNHLAVPCDAFLLGFGSKNTLRVAYAASFGQVELDPATRQLFEAHIMDFDAIAVREQSGVDICSSLGRDDALWVPDPTLLFDQEKWRTMLSLKPATTTEPYTFAYTLGNSTLNDKSAILDFITRKSSRKVVEVSANNDFSGNFYPTIEQWIEHIADADFMLTSSFHGVVFCIIFHTNFVVLPNTGKVSGMNERIYSLLRRLGLADHIAHDYDEAQLTELMEKTIDWETVDAEIKKWGQSANDYLINALKKGNHA